MIPFTKAHACGNDFLIVTEEAVQGRNPAELTRRLCARNSGIGADGVEFFTWTGPNSGRIRLHNADGSIAEISGNGTRCVAAWMARERGLHPGDELRIETDAGLRLCRVNALKTDGEFTVEVTAGMGIPSIAPRTVMLANGLVGRFAVNGVEVSTGNPHFVVLVEDADFAVTGLSWQEIGAEICCHFDFPRQTNVEFFRIVSPTKIEIRIFERGVGPTSSSGTGTSATATAAIALHGCQSPLTVVAPGGAQTVEWDGPGTELRLTGPASLIARGEAWPA
ncbi:MAG: diaminopimelate epimerase [Terracidiphilus sp.]